MLMISKNCKDVSAQFFVEVFYFGRKAKKNSLISEFFKGI
jgi:hypothetical protein